MTGAVGQGSEPSHAAVAAETADSHAALVHAIHAAEAALTSPLPGREERWLPRVVENLEAVVEELRQHASRAEQPGGLIAQVEIALGHTAAITRAIDDHQRLLNEAVQIIQISKGPHPSHPDVRAKSLKLLEDLRHHRALEADLLYEALSLDIGVGD